MKNQAYEISEFLNYLKFELGRTSHTIEAYGRDLREFADFITGGNPEEFDAMTVTTYDIRSWIASLGTPGITTISENKESAATIRRKVQSLRSFFKYLMRRKGRKDNPTEEIILPRLQHHLPNFIREREMEDLLNLDNSTGKENTKATEIRNHLIIEMLYSTGLRQSELISITDDDLYHSSGELRVTGKRGKQRILPLPAILTQRIRTWQHLRDEQWPDLKTPRPLFATAQGAISKARLYEIVKNMLKDTSTGRKSPHTLRHTFATSMLNGGADLNDVKDLLGHSSLTTTQIYTHVTFAEMKDAYNSAHPRGNMKALKETDKSIKN